MADDVPFETICNSGASCCTFQLLSFFPHGIQEPSHDIHLGGIADSLSIQGIGTAVITLCTHHSLLICLQIPHSLYVPDLTCNLLSPQWLVSTLQKQNKRSSFHIFPNGCLFLLDNHVIPLAYHPTSNLPASNFYLHLMHKQCSHKFLFMALISPPPTYFGVLL